MALISRFFSQDLPEGAETPKDALCVSPEADSDESLFLQLETPRPNAFYAVRLDVSNWQSSV